MSVILCICIVAVTTCSYFIQYQSSLHSCRDCPCWQKLNTGEMHETIHLLRCSFAKSLRISSIHSLSPKPQQMSTASKCSALMLHFTHGQQGSLSISFVTVKELSALPDCAELTTFSRLSHLLWLMLFFKHHLWLRLREQPLCVRGAWKLLLLFVTYFSSYSFCHLQITCPTPLLLWWWSDRNSVGVPLKIYSLLLYILHCTCLDKPQIVVLLQLRCKTMG